MRVTPLCFEESSLPSPSPPTLPRSLGDTQSPVSAVAARARLAVNEGCAPIAPLTIGANVVFVSRDRRRLLEIGYNFQINGYETRDLTLLNGEIGLTR